MLDTQVVLANAHVRRVVIERGNDRVQLPGCVLRRGSAERNKARVSARISCPRIRQAYTCQLGPNAPRRYGCQVPEVDRTWTIVEDPGRGSHGCLPISGHVPSEANARSDVRPAGMYSSASRKSRIGIVEQPRRGVIKPVGVIPLER